MSEPKLRVMAFALRNEASDSLDLVVYDVIGKNFFGEGISAGDVVNKLQAAPKAKTINLRVNSRGGLLDDAKAMVNLLTERREAGTTINGFVDGLAASSAAVLLTAAGNVKMPANAFQMVHQVSARAAGNAGDLEAIAAQMRRENEKLAETFAAVSTRRGKTKTKQQWLDLLMSGDVYMDAAQAIEWGIADEKVEDLKIAACLADLSDAKGAPEALLLAPFVCTADDDPRLVALLEQDNTNPIPTTPPAPEARTPAPVNLGEEHNNMALPKFIITAFSLPEDADEGAAVAAVTRLKNSAKVGADIEQLLGVSGQAALGAVRALKEGNEANAELGTEVAKLKIVNVRREFDGLIASGTDVKAKKLSPAVVKLYNDRFDAALKLAQGDDGDADAAAAKASDICADLKGFLAVAPRITSGAINPPSTGGGGGSGSGEGGGMQHGGKSFEAMAPKERKALKDENPDLYDSMREDAQSRNAI